MICSETMLIELNSLMYLIHVIKSLRLQVWKVKVISAAALDDAFKP